MQTNDVYSGEIDKIGPGLDMGLQIALLDRVAVPVYAIGTDGLCTAINAAALETFGYAAEDCIGKDLHRLLHYKREDGTFYPVEECPLYAARFDRKPVLHVEEVLWTKTGEAVDVDCSSIPIMVNAEPRGAVITLSDQRPRRVAEAAVMAAEAEQREMLRQRDATARVEQELATEAVERQRDLSRILEKVAAEQLHVQQELLTAVAENAPVGIAVYDRVGQIVWHNPWFQNFLDPLHATENLIGRNVGEIIPAAAESTIRTIFDYVREAGEPFTATEFGFEGLQRGTTYWRWSLSRLGSGHFMSVSVDMTEQVNARREIEQIYQNAPIALALVDAKDFRFRRANALQAENLGVDSRELIGRSLDEVFDVPEVRRLFEEAAQGRAVINEVAAGELPSSPGDLRYWRLNLQPVLGEDGHVEAISAGGTEITTQKRAEDALIENNRMAAVGRLAASISHEINNPLEAVTNLLYLLQQDRTLSRESQEYVGLAMSELGRVSQIASQTLRFHRQGTEPSSLTPELLVAPVIALYQGKLHHTKTRIERSHRDQEVIVCYEGEVRQVLNNLIGNALDAMPNGGRVLIRTRRARHPRTGAAGTRITVADTGTGMSRQHTERIFEPFYTTKGAGGSGLGLWISNTIAEKHGGRLQVRSSQDPLRRGTTFSLFLPQISNHRVF